MPSTDEIVQSLGESSFFLIGDGGSGKTTMAATFPDPYFSDFDKGLAGQSHKKIQFDTFKDAPYKGKALPNLGIYKYGDAYPRFLDRMNQIGDMMDKGTWPHKTLVLDSATMLSNICMNYVLVQDSKAGKQPAIQNWGAQTQLLETVFDQLTAWPGIKIITAHVQRNTNDLTETIEMLPLLTGKFAAKSSIYFDEVYFLEIDRKDKENPKTILRTRSTAMMKQARSRFRIPDGIDATYQAVEKAFKARPKL